MTSKINQDQPLQLTLNLASNEVRSIFEHYGNFHDAVLNRVTRRESVGLLVEIIYPRRNLVEVVNEIDRLTKFLFCLAQPKLNIDWGTDEEICSSAIYDFSISDGNLHLETGDGTRSGEFDIARSYVEISSVKKIRESWN